MTQIKDIKDRTPNPDTVRLLEEMLESAKSGELRSLIALRGWDDNNWQSIWSLDDRNTRAQMIGELAMLYHETLTNASLKDSEGVLYNAFDE